MPSDRQRLFLHTGIITLLVILMGTGAYVGFESGAEARHKAALQPTTARPELTTTELEGHADESLQQLLERYLRTRDENLLARLLPHGLTEISGSGGRGLQRQVRAYGMWFPVFDLSQLTDLQNPEADQIRLNSIPLTIANPHPPVGRVNELFSHRFSAIGGQPPYFWSVRLESDPGVFSFDEASGELSGMTAEPVHLTMNVFVKDALGAQVSAVSSLVITSGADLEITTSELPLAQVHQIYTAQLTAAGGAAPYRWSLLASSPGWTCEENTGVITTTWTQPGEQTLHVTVSDLETQVSRSFTVRTGSDLGIVTASPLPPAAPKAPYQLRFEAAGGSPPYLWRLTKGSLPAGWVLSEKGDLEGLATDAESRHTFAVEVTDALGLTFEKTFELAIRQGLLAIPSREKVGLAWRYDAMSASLGLAVKGVSLKRHGVEIYRGQGTNYVDRQQATGSSPFYELSAITASGLVPYAAARVTVLPIQLRRAVAGTSADPFADRVPAFAPLSTGGYGATHLPFNVTGPPDGASTFTPAYLPGHLVSLHASDRGGGSIVLEFTDNIIESGPGPDFTVFENVFFQNNDPNQRFMEPALVEVALFEGEWHRFPCRVSMSAAGEVHLRQPSYYAKGFAGVNATTGEAPNDPTRSGGDSFDLADLGRPDLTWIRFIRLIATGDAVMRDANGLWIRHTAENSALNGRASSGFDLDGVCAIHY